MLKKRNFSPAGWRLFTIVGRLFFGQQNGNVLKNEGEAMAATIIDVARLCGYSKTTVSRAYASPEAVSEKARERIYAAAKQLNYAPNAIARAMVRQRTENIAFIIHEKQYPAILNPFLFPTSGSCYAGGDKTELQPVYYDEPGYAAPNGDIYIKKHRRRDFCRRGKSPDH